MRKLVITAAACVVAAASGGPERALAAEAAEAADAECCWLYCETYRDLCEYAFEEDADHCDAFYEGCIDGCRYPDGPTS